MSNAQIHKEINTKEILRTTRFEIYPIGEKEDLKSFYNFFNKTLKAQKIAMQNTYNFLMQREIIKDNMAEIDENFLSEYNKISKEVSQLYDSIKGLKELDDKYIKTKKKIDVKYKSLNRLKNDKNKESEKILTEALGYKKNAQLKKLIKSKNNINIPYTTYLDVGVHYAEQDFNNDYIELYQGKRSPKVYKSNTLLKMDSSHFKPSALQKEPNSKYYWNWHKWKLKINLGRKPSHAGSQREALDGIIDGRYKVGMSSVQRKGKKLYLLIPMTQTVSQPVLDPERILGIDLGINIPAYGVFNFNTDWGRQFGNKRELLDFKTKIKKLKDREKSKMVFARGGHGRKRKMKNNRLEALRNREANFSQTYNHTLAKQIVDHAVKNRCGKIRMEKLSSGGFDGKTLGNWTYYQLQNYVEQKADRAGIEIEFIPPHNTSKTCSSCGYLKKDFKLGNRDGKDGRQFHCPKCGLKINSDKNAAINIVNGGCG